MKKLYDLYDYFTELKKRDDLSSLCHNISDIAMKYESVLQECNGKDNLWDKLSNLRHVISRDQLVAKNICTKNTFDSYFLKMHPTPREESTAPKIVQAQVQHRNHGKAYTAPTVSVPLPQRHGRKSVETPPPPQVTVPSSRAHGRDSVQTSTPTPVSVSLSQAPVLEEQVREESKQTLSVSPELIQLPLARTLTLPLPSLESSETEETDVYARPRGITESETEPELELQQEQPQEQGYRPGHDVYPFSKDGRYIYPEAGYPSAGSMQSTFDTGTIMGTIKGAVSNVLEAVEPVPVLGVSGGMGALYLLLKYFTYNDYRDVKESFVYVPRETIDVSLANYLINSVHNTPDNEKKLRETFYEFKKLVRRHHSFMTYYPEKCCNYINYWLNKTVRESDYRVNEENFNIFEEFMQVDPKIGKNNFNCISRLSYMDNDSFQKMKKLYDLYDYFTELKKKEDLSSLCRNISFLNWKYLNVMKECKRKDDNLCKMLTILKDVISKDELVAKDICTKNTFDSFILKIHAPKKPTVIKKVQVYRKPPGRTPTRSTVSVSSSRAQGLEKPEQVFEEKAQVLEEQVPEEFKPTLSVPQEEFPLPRPLTLLPLGQLEPLRQSETEESSETEEYIGPKGPYGIPESELRQEQLQEHYADPFREDEGKPSRDSMLSASSPEKIMETIKGAVSDVLESVEPVPVLCVSGGMGALYLLFKVSKIALKLFKLHFYNYNTYK
ncbi:hypothetical protein PVIIG_05834 [Plasmodium vivax India VII]|uniref:VIR protein n=1 Tax=Plasmodium vivax India VII TaxID=1077284 RepID=A0A0J9S253_PLAVI|nr:hypothetical protein PVIIG_05834 [Plasmodium vivax India VII]